MTPKELAERLRAYRGGDTKYRRLMDEAADLIDRLTSPPDGEMVERVAKAMQRVRLLRRGYAEDEIALILASDDPTADELACATAAIASISPTPNEGFPAGERP